MVIISLNVYDLNSTEGSGYVSKLNDATNHIGLGVFHSGIQVEGSSEYFYGFREEGSGVCRCKPKNAVPEVYRFRENVLLGECDLSELEIRQIVMNMANSERWQGPSYDITRNNCNIFSDTLSKTLTGQNIPGWVNRGADGITAVRDFGNKTKKTIDEVVAHPQVQHAVEVTSTFASDVSTAVKTNEHVKKAVAKVNEIATNESIQAASIKAKRGAVNLGNYLGNILGSVAMSSVASVSYSMGMDPLQQIPNNDEREYSSDIDDFDEYKIKAKEMEDKEKTKN